VPQWDNTPRHKSDAALIIRGSTPELYEQWLRGVIAHRSNRAPEENIVFVNAWNEWAEGAHLEPDLKFGHAYLEATKRALRFTPEDAPEHPEQVHSGEKRLIPPVLSLQDRYARLSERYAKLQQRFTEQLGIEERTALVQALKDNLSRHQALNADLQKSITWSESQRVGHQESVTWYQGQVIEIQKGLKWSESQRQALLEGTEWLEGQLNELRKGLEWSEAQRQALQIGNDWLEGQLSEVRKSLEWSETQGQALQDSVAWLSHK